MSVFVTKSPRETEALAEKMAKDAGFTAHGIITENGIIYVPIEK